jgi:hypothetical protein
VLPVICHGNQRQVIFRSNTDWSILPERLEHYHERYVLFTALKA